MTRREPGVPPTRPVITIGDAARPTHNRAPRTQRDAGIEFMEWEHRLPGLQKSWLTLATQAGIVSAAAAMTALAIRLL